MKGYRIVPAHRKRPRLSRISKSVNDLWKQRDIKLSSSEYYDYLFREMPKRGYFVVPANDYTDKNWPEIHYYLKIHIGPDHYTWSGHLFFFETEDAAFQFRMFCQ